MSTTAPPAVETATAPAPQPATLVRATDLGLRTRRGWVFRDVSAAVRPGTLMAITGPAHSGRTSLLLALTGRFVTNRGSLALPRRAHRALALGLVPGVHEPEPGLTAAEHVEERLLLLGRLRFRPRARRRYARHLLAASVYDGPLDTLGRDLDPLGRHRLCLALALLDAPALVAVDDVDVALTAGEQAVLHALLRDVAAGGTAVLAVAREPFAGTDHTIELTRETA